MKIKLLLLFYTLISYSCSDSKSKLPDNIEREKTCQSCVNQYSSILEVDEHNKITNFPSLNLEKVDVIGLGESTHGSKTEMEIKTLLIDFLFQKYDFEKVYYEANYVLIKKVNEHLSDSTQLKQSFLNTTGQ